MELGRGYVGNFDVIEIQSMKMREIYCEIDVVSATRMGVVGSR